MVPLRIRPAHEEDVPALTRLGRQLLELHAGLAPQWLVPAGGPEQFAEVWGPYLRQFLAEPGALVLAAEAPEVVGYLMAAVRAHPPVVAGPPDLMVYEVAVAPSHQGCGIGAALMRAAYRWGRERGCGYARLHVFDGNTQARAFYEREGFEACERVLLRRIDDRD
jgi:ribosomal protein S18 acetylase RimI-like enzyme